MALAQEDIEFIKKNLGNWLAEQSLGKPQVVYEIELRERMVRVEEELKHQRELMRQGFEMMERRFSTCSKRLSIISKPWRINSRWCFSSSSTRTIRSRSSIS